VISKGALAEANAHFFKSTKIRGFWVNNFCGRHGGGKIASNRMKRSHRMKLHRIAAYRGMRRNRICDQCAASGSLLGCNLLEVRCYTCPRNFHQLLH
jgi:hypothetical protein